MRITKIAFYLLITAAVTCGSIASAQRSAPRAKLTHISVKAFVEAVDLENRKLTLRSEDGSVETISVGEEVKRLDEVNPGDSIVTDFYQAVTVEFRNPTLAELESPIMAVADGAVSEDGDIPAGVVVTGGKAIVTIEAISRYDMTVTVRDMLGDYTTIPVEDEILLQDLSIGQFLTITILESMAISLEIASE